jgi:hypothetical protein
LPVWATLKLCYADPQLKVSKEEFERPENLSIKWIVTLLQKQKNTTAVQNTDELNLKRLRSYFQIYVAAIVETNQR